MKWTAESRNRSTASSQPHVRWCSYMRSHSGLTLVELIIALAIISLIAGVTVVAIHQLLTASRQANEQQYAVSQLRQAEHFMSRDILMAWTVDIVNPDFFLALSWNSTDETEEVKSHLVTYTFEGPSGARGQLQRSELVDGSPQSSVIVAQSIDGSARWIPEAYVLRVTLTASANGHEEMRVFDVKPRKTHITIVEEE